MIGDLEIAFRLPLPGAPRAVFQSDYGYRGAALVVDGRAVIDARSREELEEGAGDHVARLGAHLRMQLVTTGGAPRVVVEVNGVPAPRESDLHAPTSRSAWIHAIIALVGSAAGFAASYFYLRKSWDSNDPWANKMGLHTAGWHLLLTFTLFPLSVWGQRLGIRAVQAVSLLFFGIHVSIALANSDLGDPFIALFNALSGIAFLASVIYGQRAYRDMDPLRAMPAIEPGVAGTIALESSPERSFT